MQVFEILRSIETKLIQSNNSQIKDIINPEKCYLITDDDNKKIFILKGEKSTLVYFLIAKKIALEIRKLMRGFYGIEEIKSIEQALAILNETSSQTGNIKECVNPNVHPKDDPLLNPNNTDVFLLNSDPAWRKRIQVTNLPVFKKKQNIERTLEQIKLNKLDPKYKREMVIINSSIYTPTKELKGFLKERKEEHIFEKIGELTEGKFFVPDYSCRFIVKGEKINSIELLRKKNQSNSTSDKINAPILFIRRIVTERPIETLKDSFDLPKIESIDELIQKVRKLKTKDEKLVSTLEKMKDKS